MNQKIKMKGIIMSALFWITIYLLIVLAPLVVLNIGEVPPGSGFWWDFSMAMGFAGMAIVRLILSAPLVGDGKIMKGIIASRNREGRVLCIIEILITISYLVH